MPKATVSIVTITDSETSELKLVVFVTDNDAEKFIARAYVKLAKEHNGETADDDSQALEESLVEAYENEDYELVATRAIESDEFDDFKIGTIRLDVMSDADEVTEDQLPSFHF